MGDHFLQPPFATTVKVKKLFLNPLQVSQNGSSPIEEISLKINVRSQCNHFLVAEDNTITLESRHKTRKLPLAFDRLLVSIFNIGDEALEQYLSGKFERYEHPINAQTVADEIKRQWVQLMREDANSSMFGRVFPLEVSLKLWHAAIVYDREPSMNEITDGMVPASDASVEEMLKRIEIEEIKEDDLSCVICLEEIVKEEKSTTLSQMPCLHLFHEECIKKWLKKSHYCPTCRFQMPTN